MKKHLLIVFGVLLACASTAQDIPELPIPQLFGRLSAARSDTARLHLLLDLADAYVLKPGEESHDLDSAFLLIGQCCGNAEKTKKMRNLYQFKGNPVMTQPMELTILGKAGKKVLQKLSKRYFRSLKKRWLFIDFAEMNIPLHSRFDVLLKVDNKALIPSFHKVTVLECLDQFGNQLTAVPEGYKTICRLEFHPRVPSAIDELPSLETWKSNPSHITLANHADLRWAFTDPYLNDLSPLAFSTFLEQMTPNKQAQSVSDFYSFLEKKYKMNKSQADRVLGVFMQMGKIKRTVDNIIELAPAV